MERREFFATGIGGALGARAVLGRPRLSSPNALIQDHVRASFPRLARETFINAAAGTPLGTFAENSRAVHFFRGCYSSLRRKVRQTSLG